MHFKQNDGSLPGLDLPTGLLSGGGGEIRRGRIYYSSSITYCLHCRKVTLLSESSVLSLNYQSVKVGCDARR